MIHRGFYEPLTEAEAAAIVERYDDKAAHLGLNENWREQGWSHYLEWFFAKWLPALETPENSAGLLATLRAIEPCNGSKNPCEGWHTSGFEDSRHHRIPAGI